MSHIVHLAHHYFPHVGGVEYHLEKVNEVLLKKGYTVSVITTREAKSDPLKEVKNGVHIYRLALPVESSGWRYKFALWQELWKLRKVWMAADVLQIHDVFFWMLPFLWRVPKKRIHMTFHGYEGDSGPTFWPKFWHKLANRWCHSSLCVGDFHAVWYGVKPTAVMYGGVEPVKSISQPTSSRLMYLGRLDSDAGAQESLEAFRQYAAAHPDTSLDVYGDGPLRLSLEKFVSKHHLNVKFLGAQPTARTQMNKYSLVLTSRYLGILEALNAGRPVIAEYHNPIKRDYLERAPFARWIAVGGSVNKLTQALEKWHAEKTLDPAAQVWAQKQTWEKVVAQYEACWSS